MNKTQPYVLSKEENRKYILYCVLMMAIIVFSCFFTQFHRNSPGVIKEVLSQTFSMTSVEYANFSSMYFYPYMLMQIPVGLIVDKFGTKKTLAGSLFVCAVATILFSTANSYTMLCVSRALIGIGVSTPVVCTSKFYSTWFRRKRAATAHGIGQGLQSVLGLLGQTPLAIAVGYFSWRHTFLAIGIGTLVIVVIVLIFLKDSPQKVGLPSVQEMDGTAPVKSAEKIRSLESIKLVYTNKYTWPFLVLLPIIMGTYNMFSTTWLIPYVTDVMSCTTVEATKYSTIMMVGMMVANFTFNLVSDLLKRRKPVYIFGFSCLAVGWVFIAFFTPFVIRTNTLAIFCFLMGLSQGNCPLSFALLRELNHPDIAGSATGCTNMIGMLGSCIFPLIVGAIIDSQRLAGTGNIELYRSAFTFSAILAIAALVIVLFVKETRCANIYFDKIRKAGK